ncbi:MAG: transglutaminase family protein [Myxococcales bacterium]
MLLRVAHQSLYRYDVPIRLADHVLRLTPRSGSHHLVSHVIDVEPMPIARSEETDAEGNRLTRLQFLGETNHLRVDSRFELETFAPPPFGPVGRPLAAAPGPWLHPEVRAFAERAAAEVAHEPVAFLDQLCSTLFSGMHRHVRSEGAARAAHETLAAGGGACRDLTVLFLESCRVFGLEGRFVSGYQAQADTPDGQRHLHAWAEVFVEGAGFRGWDPMHGVRVTDGHVALCAARTQAETMPIEGGFFFDGPRVNSTLDHSVRISSD